jgi:DNA-binding winged helix-turn-helix (wHTH) protein
VVYVFGDQELDEGLFQLRRAGRAIVIQPKVLSLLLYLVRNRDRMVSKEEILAAVWPDVSVCEPDGLQSDPAGGWTYHFPMCEPPSTCKTSPVI